MNTVCLATKINAQQNSASCPSSTCNLRVMSIHFIIHQGPGSLSKPSTNGLLCPTTQRMESLFYAQLGLSDLHLIMCTSSAAITNDYSLAWHKVKRVSKVHCLNSWRIRWQRPTSDFPARIWTMTSFDLLSAASEARGWCSDRKAICCLRGNDVTAASDASSAVALLSASNTDCRLFDTVLK